MLNRTIILAAAGMLVGGCATVNRGYTSATQGVPNVDNVELARLPPDQLGQVNDLRNQLIQADNEVNRAKLGVRDADRDNDIAKQESKVADEQRKLAQKRVQDATNTKNQQELQQAQQELEQAQGRATAGSAHETATKTEQDYANALVSQAERHRDLVNAQLQEAKYHALKQANLPSASKYSQEDFDRARQRIQNDLENAQLAVKQKENAYRTAEQNWRQSEQRLQATSRPPPG